MTAKLAARYTTFTDTLQARREAGATGLEYAGMIVVAALVVSLIYGAINNGNIGGQIGTLISNIFSGGAGGAG